MEHFSEAILAHGAGVGGHVPASEPGNHLRNILMGLLPKLVGNANTAIASTAALVL